MKKELIEKIIRRFQVDYDQIGEKLRTILEEELPDFQRIDEERFKRIYASKVCDIGLHIKEYNSTLPPALVPLPKEMPALWHDAFTDLLHNRMQPSEFYSLIRKTYGTHEPKPNLPSVEELAKEIASVRVDLVDEHKLSHKIAKKLHSKYSLHPREEKGFPFNLKKGDKFIDRDGFIRIFNGTHIIESIPGELHYVEQITPYIEPTIEQKFINSLTPEQMVMYKELNKEK